MKTISVLVPCYNEEENVEALCMALQECFTQQLPQYLYEILFIDNKSKDSTREKLEKLCLKYKEVKAIFNIKNFGQFNSPYYGLCQTTGDCTIMLCCDFQDPIEMIPTLVQKWEEGNAVVCCIKTSSRENPLIYGLRSLYYKTIRKMSAVDQIEHFTGFGLYDHSFIEIFRTVKDSTPFLRGIVAEYAPDRLEIPYTQQKRRAGKTKNNFFSLYDAAMLSFTSYTKAGLRVATFLGFCMAGMCFLISLIYLIMKLAFWERFVAGTAPIVLGIFLLGGIQLVFIGLLGEYILSINQRLMNRPLVIEEKRLNMKPAKPVVSSDTVE